MIGQEEQKQNSNICSEASRNYRPREAFKRANALCQDDFLQVLNLRKCPVSKNNAADFKCSGCCVKSFQFNDDLSRGMEKLRRHIWVEPKRIASLFPTGDEYKSIITKYEKLEGTVIRRCALLDTLFSMRHKNSNGSSTIKFRIEGVQVCKAFFKLAIGINRKLFDQVVDYVVHCEDIDRPNHPLDNLIGSDTFRSLWRSESK